MAPVIDKLRRMKQKTKEAKSLSNSQPRQDDETTESNQPKSIARLLGSAANRTFLLASPRSPSHQTSPDVSPVTIQPVNSSKIEDFCLDDADDGTEGYIRADHVDGIRVGACTTAGWQLSVDINGSGEPVRVRKKNQDAFSVEQFFGGLLAVVYDGHGAHGRAVSQTVRDVVPTVLKSYLKDNMSDIDALCGEDRRRLYVKCINKAFVDGEKSLKERDNIDETYSGTTATAVWIDGRECYVAWTGDSRAIIGSENGVIEVSWDQKPNRHDEKKRVRNAGGRVTRWKKNIGPQRVWLPDEWLPGLAMTRSIGDTILSKYGVIPNPEITVTKFNDEEQVIVIASDGIWEFMKSEEVIRFVYKMKNDGMDESEIAKSLVKEAVKKWNDNESVVDDTTAIVMFINGQVLQSRREGEGRRTFLRRKRHEPMKDRSIPWIINPNGRLEPFHTISLDYDTDDE